MHMHNIYICTMGDVCRPGFRPRAIRAAARVAVDARPGRAPPVFVGHLVRGRDRGMITVGVRVRVRVRHQVRVKVRVGSRPVTSPQSNT